MTRKGACGGAFGPVLVRIFPMPGGVFGSGSLPVVNPLPGVRNFDIIGRAAETCHCHSAGPRGVLSVHIDRGLVTQSVDVI